MSSEARIRIAPMSMPGAVATLIRDTRQTIGWSQDELAERARTSQTKIWRMERGEPGALDLATLDRVLAALGLRCTLDVEGRHLPERRAQHDLVHARLVGAMAGRLERCGWSVESEVSIGEGPPRGWIDLLAWRERDAALALIEVKTDIPDTGNLQRQVGWYAREAPWVARRLGWRPRTLAVVVVGLDTGTLAGRIDGQAALLRHAFPGDPRRLEAWLRDPGGPPPDGWTLAVTDLAAHRGPALRRCGLTGRPSAPAYRDYADAAARISGPRPRAGPPRTRRSASRSRAP